MFGSLGMYHSAWYKFMGSSILKKDLISLFSVLNRVAILMHFALNSPNPLPRKSYFP